MRGFEVHICIGNGMALLDPLKKYDISDWLYNQPAVGDR